MSNLLDDLNDKQRQAVEYMDSPLLILAGAGSGKTRVLTYKIAYMLEKNMMMPWQILAITFTNKAAKEMKQRVVDLVGDDASKIWLGTFHAICVMILKREIELIGYRKDFNIFDELDKQKILKDILKKLNLDKDKYPINYIVYEISRAKDSMKDAAAYLLENKDDFRKQKVAEIYKIYQDTLKQNNAIDFDDIILLTVQIFLKYPDRLKYYQDKFKYILVDEYQDTNKIQFMLISLLAQNSDHICVVGDESQSIYGFRGADISNILNFEQQFKGAKIMKLEENYRSTKTILSAANEVIKNNKSKIDKNLWTQNDQGTKIEYYTAGNEYSEIEYVVDKIDKLCRDYKLKYSDFAVLFRTNAQARVIEDVFVRTATPYRRVGGVNFYSRKEIKDLISYLRLIQNQDDNVSLLRIINEPKRGIGDSTMENIENSAIKAGISIFNYIKDDANLEGIRCAKNIKEFVSKINLLIELKEKLKVPELMKQVLTLTGYEDMLKEDDKENEIRIENLSEFIGSAEEFVRENVDNSLGDFLDSIAILTDVDQKDDVTIDKVTIMTMHSAKGLEFGVVFLVGMEDGLFPSKKSIEEEANTEEERRLCYVAITRAKKKLYITNAQKRTLYGTTTYTVPSRFISEIPAKLFETDEINLPKYNKNSFLNSEYAAANKVATRKIDSYNKNTNNSTNTSKSKIGISVDSFLKNIYGSSNVNPNAQTDIDISKYQVGMKVRHKRFGVGTIQKIEKEENDAKLEIVFETAGFKRVMAKYTPLDIL